MQAKRDNLTESPLAGHDYRQVYFRRQTPYKRNDTQNAAR
jgi:hypothetical protein